MSEMKNTQRMEWLDALRGFTMILVVAYHVAQISYGQTLKSSASLPFMVLFRMPLFFFVSGFLSYRARFIWSATNTVRLLGKKFRIQVFPALCFLCFCIILRQKDFGEGFMNAMHSSTKGGYWFTWVLLQMFLIYYVFSFFTRSLSHRAQSRLLLVLWFLSLLAYESCYLPKVFEIEKCQFLKTTSLLETMRFFHFFLMGNLVHRHWQGMQRLFDAVWFFPLLCMVAFFCCADLFRWHNLQFAWTNLPRTMAMYCLMFIVVLFFRYYQRWFTRQTVVGRSLQYVGTRTLDIYLLHFILMPKLPAVGKWMDELQPNFILDILLSILPALVIVAFCLLISNILRVSPLFSENFFGRKVK